MRTGRVPEPGGRRTARRNAWRVPLRVVSVAAVFLIAPLAVLSPVAHQATAAGSSSSSWREHSGASRTEAAIYEAFTASGKPAIQVTKTIHGYCWEGSLATARDDAWRCLNGNLIYDPCFSSSKAKGIVLCVVYPWTRSGVEMKLTKPLPKPWAGKPSTKGLPWGMRTTSGLECVMATGGTAAIKDVRANYFCQNSTEWLWGSPSRKTKFWTIYIAPLDAKKLSARVKVADAWF